MIIIKKYTFLTFATCILSLTVMAQSTVNSPYSKFGVGNITGSYLPQNKGFGNLAYGISSYGGYQNINISNPASYSKIRLTTFDVGARSVVQKLSKNNESENSFNGSLNHLIIAIPTSKTSAFSFGILPYSNLGYQFNNTAKVDTINFNHAYSGEGGLTKGYLGYGIGIGKNFNVGLNMSYIFGSLKETRAADFSTTNSNANFLNSKTEDNNAVGGLYFDLGAQYVGYFDKNKKITVGYTGGANTQLNTKFSQLITRNYISVDPQTQVITEIRADTIAVRNEVAGKLTLPSNHNFGISIEKLNNWLIGADIRMANWSNFRNNGVNQNLNNTFGLSVGAQITPNINAVTQYVKLMDYRVGFNYDKTYTQINGTDIDVKSLNFGLGFPLVSSRSAFYKINFATEIGTRGTIKNNLVKENFVNFTLGFTINDRWFQKYKYD
jgi:hypothetical protein